MMLKEYVITNHCGPLKTMQNTIHSNIKHIICTHLLNVFCDGLELRCLVKPLLGYVLALLIRSSITYTINWCQQLLNKLNTPALNYDQINASLLKKSIHFFPKNKTYWPDPTRTFEWYYFSVFNTYKTEYFI